LAVPLVATKAFCDESFTISQVRGAALVREVGDYMWRRPSSGDNLYAGDRLRVRRGELILLLPQSMLKVVNEGEVEISVELSDGFCRPWDNDIELFIGSYVFKMNRQKVSKELRLHTPYSEIEASDDAIFEMEVTAKGSKINVISGKVFIKHYRDINADETVIEAGNRAQIGASRIFLPKNSEMATMK